MIKIFGKAMLFAWLMFPEVSKGSAFKILGNSTLQHPEDQNFLKHCCENL